MGEVGHVIGEREMRIKFKVGLTPIAPQVHYFSEVKVKGKSTQVLYSDHLASTPFEWTPFKVPVKRRSRLELYADVIVSAAARRSISVGPKKSAAAARRGRPKTSFSKIHEKISFHPHNFLSNFFSHQSFEVCR